MFNRYRIKWCDSGSDSLFEYLDSWVYNDLDSIKEGKLDKDGNLVYEIDCPGFNKDTLKVNIDGDYVIIKGKTEKRSINQSFIVLWPVTDERHVPIRLSRYDHQTEAEVKDGVLTLKFIKSNYITKEIELK